MGPSLASWTSIRIFRFGEKLGFGERVCITERDREGEEQEQDHLVLCICVAGKKGSVLCISYI